MLASLGVTRYDQIAGWSDADIARVDPQLGAFQGRIARDNWIEQCRYLAAGDTAGFESRFGKV
jgi:predicted flap endonuclease-1-like 5' DNA nuclease